MFPALTRLYTVEYVSAIIVRHETEKGEDSMSVLVRKYKLPNGMVQEERIDDPDRIERYMRLFERDDIKKLEAGGKVVIEKDEWQLLP